MANSGDLECIAVAAICKEDATLMLVGRTSLDTLDTCLADLWDKAIGNVEAGSTAVNADGNTLQ